VNTAVYGVVRYDTGAISINLEFFKSEEVLEGGRVSE
jgi:hypothetical protein